jgi:hypothetical protein
MWAIIRFSVNNENNSALRNKLRDALKTHIRLKENTGTYRTWRKRGITEKEMALVLKRFWSAASSHQGPGYLDHFWMYTEQQSISDLK